MGVWVVGLGLMALLITGLIAEIQMPHCAVCELPSMNMCNVFRQAHSRDSRLTVHAQDSWTSGSDAFF